MSRLIEFLNKKSSGKIILDLFIPTNINTRIMNISVKLASLWIPLILMMISCNTSKSEKEQDQIIHTVTGTISVDQLGFALTHEHLMSNFGMEINSTSQYDETALMNQVVPYVEKIKSLGVNSIFDCTTAFFGRRVDILKKIAENTGVQIITNTGFYGAANDRYIPDFAYELSAEEISKIWIEEFENGIDESNIKPGFIKLAFDDGSPSDIDKKLFEAGVLTHKQTGLTIGVHTGDNQEAVNFQMELLEKHNLSASSWVWIHANKVEDTQVLMDAASKGAWTSLDGVKTQNVDEYIERLKLFKTNKLLHKVLLSHDGNGFPKGGSIREFEVVMTELIPALLDKGFTQKEINQLMIENPKEAFSIKIRQATQ
jgi:phosphotriesterase-related protein